ncbi:GNAT family N-acetyltransferase [Sphingobium sp. JS3065]|uniref:GNAT family N-acetyltransferase n=1 Tax=Sphingobium sp. JS3065 TaxID=2970925 RepID=UPI002264DF72|nr:GNAT family N-acetyltransferase [Sphingobium sp. JS3065]UZW54245.1 GNAT family N-acetyltransferase [Sphingobium sp. JS3065]
MPLLHRLAIAADEPALAHVMALAIDRLQSGFLTPEQVRASHAFMGLDSRLIADGTYFVIEAQGRIAGCGGWSRRATAYGGNHSDGRDDRLLDPATEAAKVRAMYTHPDHVRKGVGTLILSLCEAAARAEGFVALELSATMAGVPLYRSFGFVDIRAFEDRGVPLILMRKAISGQSPDS